LGNHQKKIFIQKTHSANSKARELNHRQF